jgi:hypothetical protein
MVTSANVYSFTCTTVQGIAVKLSDPKRLAPGVTIPSGPVQREV